MMFCTKCGNIVDEGQRFCTKCGAVVKGACTPQNTTEIPEDETRPIYYQAAEQTTDVMDRTEDTLNWIPCQQQNPPNQTMRFSENKPSKKKSKVIPIAIGCVVLAIAAAGAGFMVFGEKNAAEADVVYYGTDEATQVRPRTAIVLYDDKGEPLSDYALILTLPRFW